MREPLYGLGTKLYAIGSVSTVCMDDPDSWVNTWTVKDLFEVKNIMIDISPTGTEIYYFGESSCGEKEEDVWMSLSGAEGVCKRRNNENKNIYSA